MNNPDEPELPLFGRSKKQTDKAVLKNLPEQVRADSYGKYIVYVDESGDHAMQSIDEQYPVFVLAFCVFHKRHYSERVVPALELFKFKHFGHDQIVLHENEIRKEKGVFRIFPTKEHKNQFLGELTTIIAESKFILISCVIRKHGLKEQQDLPQHPYLVARPIGLQTFRQGQPNRAFDILKKKFFCSGSRKNTGEGYEEWGLKIHPPIKSERP